MGKFDLNNPIDFGILTQGAGDALFGLTGRSDWDILEGAYYHDAARKVLFHVFVSSTDYGGEVGEITDTIGRRKAKFEFPYLDGQLTEDLGRKPGAFEINIILHGPRYLKAYQALINELNDPRPGFLQHPILGEIQCVMEDCQVMHQSSQRQAVALRLTLIEHSFQGVSIREQKDSSAPAAIQKAVDAFKKIDDAISAVENAAALPRAVKNQIDGLLNSYKDKYAQVLNRINRLFNRGSDIPALLPVNGGGIQAPGGQIVAQIVPNVLSPNDPFTGVPDSVDSNVLEAVEAEQIAKEIDVNRTQLAQLITSMEATDEGQGSLIFYENIQDLRTTANDMQSAYDKGKQSSNFKLIEYTVPRVMSVREVAFANNIDVDDFEQILLLNPWLESANYIEPGLKLKLAVNT